MQPRVPALKPEAMNPDQRAAYDAILAGPRKIVEGPLAVWLRSAELAERAQALGAFCRFGTSLPPALSELAILVTGAHWRAGFEWHVHAPIAQAAGVDETAIAAIKSGETVTFADEPSQAVYELARELWETRAVSDGVYHRAVAAMGLEGTVELVGILGYYGLISMTIKAFRVPVPPGADEPF
ncbi:MAG: 4-carboxymuconolactone decarboxylase [Acidiphilium sp. 21-60-14]|nr:MAG: 4-carboxymuconolactone decarboxylase [Acidiphilium sp. 21-60-14]OZB39423.1 MAG: 4-carboxymuconolactone decarboxylase [Acidiphilium sp. 34-60-192]HQU23455.1 carboxymuconolactone decarboxylase family protein [Acidiphilium sp.]